MNTTPPLQPDDEHAIERLLEALRRKEPVAAPTIAPAAAPTVAPPVAPTVAPTIIAPPVVPPVAPPHRAEEDDLPLLTDIVRAEHALRARSAAVRQRPVEALSVPPLVITPPPARNDAAAAQAAVAAQIAEALEAARLALKARLQAEIPHLVANALHNALPGLVAEILQGVQDAVERGQKDGTT